MEDVPDSEFLGWDNVPKETIGKDSMSFEESLKDSRHRGFLYAHALSDKLCAEILKYVQANAEATNLVGELGVFRYLLAQSLTSYQASLELPSDTAQQQSKKLAAISFYADEVFARGARLQSMCQTAARIEQGKQGKIDLVMINTVVSAVTKSVDEGLQHFKGPMVAAGTDPQDVMEHITSRISGAVRELAPTQQQPLIEANALVKRTSLTSDQLVQQMDDLHLNGATNGDGLGMFNGTG